MMVRLNKIIDLVDDIKISRMKMGEMSELEPDDDLAYINLHCIDWIYILSVMQDCDDVYHMSVMSDIKLNIINYLLILTCTIDEGTLDVVDNIYDKFSKEVSIVQEFYNHSTSLFEICDQVNRYFDLFLAMI